AVAPVNAVTPAVTWDTTQHVVTFKAEDGSLKAVRYQANGTRTDATPLLVNFGTTIDLAAAASSGTPGTFMTWIESQVTGPQVLANTLSIGGQLSYTPGSVILSISFVDRSDASVVWRGDHYLAAWRDASNITRGVIGRISVDGQPLDDIGITVSSSASAAAPALASNGRTAVVAWLDIEGVASS